MVPRTSLYLQQGLVVSSRGLVVSCGADEHDLCSCQVRRPLISPQTAYKKPRRPTSHALGMVCLSLSKVKSCVIALKPTCFFENIQKSEASIHISTFAVAPLLCPNRAQPENFGVYLEVQG